MSPRQRKAQREALEICGNLRARAPTLKELQRIRGELLVYPSRVNALLRTLILMAFMDWKAAPDASQKIERVTRWEYVCLKIAYEHCLRRRRWRKGNG